MLTKKVSWVLGADIRGFFNTLDHGWLVRFLEHRIGDRRIVGVLQKWLRAGVLEVAEAVGVPSRIKDKGSRLKAES